MLSNISPASLSVWICTIVMQLVLALRLNENAKPFPVFRAYSYWYGVGSLVLLLIASLGSGMAYFATYYVVIIGADLLTLFVAYEVYRAVFGPRAALPQLVPERAGSLVAMAFSGAIALGVFVPAILGGNLTRTMVKTEQILTAGAWAVFLILLIYSLSLHIAWPRKVAGLAIGFVLYLSIDVLAVFARARGGYQAAAVAGTVGQVSYLLALVWWTCIFWRREAVSLPATSEQVETMKQYHRQSLEALVRCGVQVEGKR